jgi:hypothetical protein
VRHVARLAALLVWLDGIVAPSLAGQSLSFETVAVFAAPGIRESSGVAVSRQHPGVLWTHNDSGDGPFLYATNLAGHDLGRVRVAGVPADDWEDLASGRCPDTAGWCLYIADTGDRRAASVTPALYVVPEPRPTDSMAAARTVFVTYEDGPENVEALAVAPEGAVLLVSKGTSGRVRGYWLERDDLSRDTLRLRPFELGIEPLPMIGRLVTGAAFSAVGTLVVRTYTELRFFQLEATRGGRVLHPSRSCWLGLQEPQGEAVDFLDDNRLVLTSEASQTHAGTISVASCKN